jgi:predicted nucleotidyltransferase
MAALQADEVITRLREHQQELREAGVLGLSLFGSVARGDNAASSDVDSVADFAQGLSILDLVSIEARLAELLDTPVDLSDRTMLKEFVRPNAERESLHVF